MPRSRQTRWGAHRCRAGSGSSSSDVLPSRFGEAQKAPVQRALLPIALTQATGDRGLHQLLAEVEGMRGVAHTELLEHRVHVGLADEPVAVERVEPVAIGEQAVVGGRYRRLHRK